MDEICKPASCTGCEACLNVCPQNCISMTRNWNGVCYPEIDLKKCIKCNLCRKTCPSLNQIPCNYPMDAYAAWSKDAQIFAHSASGGIAAELYRLAIKNGWYIAGTVLQPDFSVRFQISRQWEDVAEFQNSKYTFSRLGENAINQICDCLKNGAALLFIGTGCQAAAIRQCTKSIKSGTLYVVDLVCHGMPPVGYLPEHIHTLEKRKRIRASSCTFRDPAFGTDCFQFSLFDARFKNIYSRKVRSEDVYQLGYHQALIYRENCYSCPYAKPERIGDITLSDYKGIGEKTPCDFQHGKMSSVLINTEAGKMLFEQLAANGLVEFHKRPVEEPIAGDPQLRSPSLPHPKRDKFLRIYSTGVGFEKAAKAVLWKKRLRYYLINITHYHEIRRWIKEKLR